MAKNHQMPAAKFMNTLVKVWFVVVCIGQSLFAYYIIMLYWKSTMLGDLERWNTAQNFYIKNDIIGNVIFGLHIALAAIITILGPLQLIPQIRNYAPKFHRVSGRIYVFSAFIISIAGLYLSWVRGSVGGLEGSILISMNALIILVTAFFAIKNAIQKKFQQHTRWAVHLFLAMSGVWLFRVFMMLWLAIFKAPVGFDPDTFTGPFLIALAIFVYIFPHVVVLFYFQAKQTSNPGIKWGFSILLSLIIVGISIGTIVATMGLWLPRL